MRVCDDRGLSVAESLRNSMTGVAATAPASFANRYSEWMFERR
jgi:hypothetical protein